MRTSRFPVLFALAAVLACVPGRAGTIPYADVGTPLSSGIDLYAIGGSVKAYFYASDAWFYSELYLDLPNAVGPAMRNNTSTPGQMFDFGTYAPGTLLRFRLHVDQRNGTFRDLYPV